MGEVHKQRRRRLAEQMGPESAALIVSHPEMVRNNDTLHEYRPNSDLVYLSGFEEPEAALLLLPGDPEKSFVMFVRPRDPEREVWTGRRAGVEGATAKFGADAAHPIADLATTLPKYLEGVESLYMNLGQDPERDRLGLEAINRTRRASRTGAKGPVRLIDAAAILHEMRLRKEPVEIEALARAAEISAMGHRAAMESVRPGMYEYEVQAILEYQFRRAGSHRFGFPSIVASGPNATILHYEENSRRLEAGDLILVDAGTEWGYMSGDITRTFPVSGKFSEAQRRAYEVVLDAQKQAIAASLPGRLFQEPHDAAVRVLTQGMIDLGLLQCSLDEALREEKYKRYYMHKTSHWLGMDVHDVGRYAEGGAPRPLEPGMVLTIEPGLYIAEDDPDAPAEFRGIGIRIEDDVLITEAGNRILTGGVPKEVAEIEAICGKLPPEGALRSEGRKIG